MERLIPQTPETLESFFQSAIPSGLTVGTQSNASLASSKCFRPSSTAVAWSSSKATKDIQEQKQQQHKKYNRTNTKSTTTYSFGLLPGASLALWSTTILMAQKFLIAGIFTFVLLRLDLLSLNTSKNIFEHFWDDLVGFNMISWCFMYFKTNQPDISCFLNSASGSNLSFTTSQACQAICCQHFALHHSTLDTHKFLKQLKLTSKPSTIRSKAVVLWGWLSILATRGDAFKAFFRIHHDLSEPGIGTTMERECWSWEWKHLDEKTYTVNIPWAYWKTYSC